MMPSVPFTATPPMNISPFTVMIAFSNFYEANGALQTSEIIGLRLIEATKPAYYLPNSAPS
jgi:hypothetical protein